MCKDNSASLFCKKGHGVISYSLYIQINIQNKKTPLFGVSKYRSAYTADLRIKSS